LAHRRLACGLCAFRTARKQSSAFPIPGSFSFRYFRSLKRVCAPLRNVASVNATTDSTTYKRQSGGAYGTAANHRPLTTPSILPAALVGSRGNVRAIGLSSSGRTFLFLLAVLLLGVNPTMAGDGATPSPAAAIPAMVWFVTSLIGCLAVVALVLTIWEKIKFSPPLHKQFAALLHRHEEYAEKVHVHPEYMTEAHFRNWRKIYQVEMAEDERNSKEMEARLTAKLDNMIASVNAHMTGVERRLGDRIDPLAETLAANRQGLNQHLEDHRAGRA
jgi:hypothetical protein